MSALTDVVFPVFLVVLAGFAARRGGILSDATMDALTRFAQTFAIPCLLFGAISTIDIAESFDPALLVSFYVPALTCFAIGILASRALGRPPEDAIAIGFCCLFSNSVLLGLPITERAFGTAALAPNYAIIAFHAPVCYAVGIASMETARAGLGAGALRRIASRAFGNALIIGIMIGLAVNLTGIPVPDPVTDATDLLGRAGLPTALFALGGVIARYDPRGELRVVALVAILSLVVHPALTWELGGAANLSEEQFRSAVVTASMAPGVNAYLFATMYGRASRVAAASVLVCTTLSLISASLWLSMLSV